MNFLCRAERKVEFDETFGADPEPGEDFPA